MVDAVLIRPARAADLAPLHALVERAYRGVTGAASWAHQGEMAAGERIGVAALAALIGDPTRAMLVAERGERLVGSALVEPFAPDICAIGLLSVDPDLQGAGLGDRLLDHAERLALARFAAIAARIEVVEHKTRLVAFYSRRGYQPTGNARPYPHMLREPTRFVEYRKILAIAEG